MTIAPNNEAFFDAIRRQGAMFTETTQVPAPQPSLRKAAVEVLLAGTIATSGSCATAAEAQAVTERLKKALEQLAEELGK